MAVSDLYADGFEAVGGPRDFVALEDPDRFHYQSEQRAAALNRGFAPDIAREQDRLRRADCLILQFPLWWGGPPAILKGWIDRVCAYGVAYADGTRFATGLFRGRRSLVSATTGGRERRFSSEGEYRAIEPVLWPIQNLFLGYLGYDLAPPHVCYGAPRIDDAAARRCRNDACVSAVGWCVGIGRRSASASLPISSTSGCAGGSAVGQHTSGNANLRFLRRMGR